MKPLVLSHQDERARLVLDALKRHRGLSDAAIAIRAGYPNHQAIHARRSGVTKISLEDAERLAMALGVEPMLFFMEPEDALRWVLDNAPSSQQPSWIARTAISWRSSEPDHAEPMAA